MRSLESDLIAPAAPVGNSAPCGPECRYAQALPDLPDYIWCAYRGAPWASGTGPDCRNFTPRRAGEALQPVTLNPPRRPD